MKGILGIALFLGLITIAVLVGLGVIGKGLPEYARILIPIVCAILAWYSMYL